ncbi:MAG TPA: hypothetical protein VFC17_08085 [Candidatus Limnocylindrales bacterium]|nr:hypothetical protein [Candidatus Limnocylindrales bacterium]
MRSITITDLRQRWPEIEAALQVEKEILIARNKKHVAKLVRLTERDVERWNLQQSRGR